MKFKEILTDKKFIYGSYATMMTLSVIAIAVIVVLIADIASDKLPIKLDLSGSGVYSISKESKEILKDIDAEVILYRIVQGGAESDLMEDMIIQQYEQATPNLKVKKIDIAKNPGFQNNFTKRGEDFNGVRFVFESGENYRLIYNSDLYQQAAQNSTNILHEQKFTMAIKHVSEGERETVAFTEGHGELDEADIANFIHGANFQTERINLMVEGKVPEHINTLIIIAPTNDFHEGEIVALVDYMDRGGNVMYLPMIQMNELKNIESFINEWGITINKDVVIETNRNNMQSVIMGSSFRSVFFPELTTHEINKNIMNINFGGALSSSMKIAEIPGIETMSLMETTSDSYAKLIPFENSDKEPSDKTGPFIIGTHSAKTNYVNNVPVTSNLIVMSDYEWLGFIRYNNYSNGDFLVSALNYINGTVDDLAIISKSIDVNMLNITSQTEEDYLKLIVWLLMPCIIVIAGIVFRVRRNKSIE